MKRLIAASLFCLVLTAAAEAQEEPPTEPADAQEAAAETLRDRVFVWIQDAALGKRFPFDPRLSALDYLYLAGADPSEIDPLNIRIATLEGEWRLFAANAPLLGGERIALLSESDGASVYGASDDPAEADGADPQAPPQDPSQDTTDAAQSASQDPTQEPPDLRVRVVGAVNRAASFPYRVRWTLERYLEAAGGLSDAADPERVWVLRENARQNALRPAAETGQILPGDAILAQFRSEPGAEPAAPAEGLTEGLTEALKDGAPLRVVVTGAVMRPAVFGYLPERTALDYIRFAGGLTESADLERAVWIRRDGSIDRADAPPLPGDVLAVPTKRAAPPVAPLDGGGETLSGHVESLNESRMTLKRFGDEFFEAGRARIRETERRVKLLETQSGVLPQLPQGKPPPADSDGASEAEASAGAARQANVRNAVTGYIGPLDQLDSNALLNIPQRRIVEPGDALRAVWWSEAGGAEPQTRRLEVSAEGEAVMPPYGAISLFGKTLGEAEEALRESVARASFSDTKLILTFESLETIHVAVAGHAFLPGSYAMSSAASLFGLLRICGGPNDLGSMRAILLKRGAQTFRIDMYDFLLRGSADQERPLRDGDLIYFPAAGRQVAARGEVSRPAVYELVEGEQHAQLFEMAGGIRPSGFAKSVQVDSARGGAERIVRNLDLTNGYADLPPLLDGDLITIHPILSEPMNTVQAAGHLRRPGQYELKEGMRVSDLIREARGLRDGAHRRRADLFRRNADGNAYTLLPVNADAALQNDPDADLPLQPFDRLAVYPESEAAGKPLRGIAVQGAVRRPGNYSRPDGMRVSDAVRMAGGAVPEAHLDRALLLRVDVRNRLAFSEPVDLRRLNESGGNAEENDPVLRDGDALLILRIDEAVWEPPQTVKVTGAAQSPGYVPFAQNMRVSDALMRAGGAKTGRDPTALLLRKAPSHARIEAALPIDLDAALRGDSEADLLLMPEDEIIVYDFGETGWKRPSEAEAVGAVQRGGRYPIAPGMRVSELLFQAGGVMPNAHLERADLYRYRDDYENRIALPIDLSKALAGDADADLELRGGDVVRVWTLGEASFTPEKTVQLYGAVQRPDLYPFYEEMTLRDLIWLAGGLTPGYGKTAEAARARQEKGSPVLRIDLEAAMAGDPTQNIALQPGDVIAVRKSGAFQDAPRSVRVSGEVAFPGSYVLEGDDRLSDILRRAGGATDAAYLPGASMIRNPELLLDDAQRRSIETVWEALQRLSELEYSRLQARALSEAAGGAALEEDGLESIAGAATGAIGRAADPILDAAETAQPAPKISLVTPARAIEQRFPDGQIAIDLPKALAQPGGESDLLLEPNDAVHIPKRRNIIAVTGAVAANIATVYVEGLTVEQYLDAAGGPTADADLERIYVSHVNGSFTRVERLERLAPGDAIIVPTRVVSEKISSGFADAANLLRFAITTAAAAAVIVLAFRS